MFIAKQGGRLLGFHTLVVALFAFALFLDLSFHFRAEQLLHYHFR